MKDNSDAVFAIALIIMAIMVIMMIISNPWVILVIAAIVGLFFFVIRLDNKRYKGTRRVSTKKTDKAVKTEEKEVTINELLGHLPYFTYERPIKRVNILDEEVRVFKCGYRLEYKYVLEEANKIKQKDLNKEDSKNVEKIIRSATNYKIKVLFSDLITFSEAYKNTNVIKELDKNKEGFDKAYKEIMEEKACSEKQLEIANEVKKDLYDYIKENYE